MASDIPVIAGVRPGLVVRMTGGAVVAVWLCSCGNHERAIGGARASQLATRATVGACPHNDPTPESARPAEVVDLAARRTRRHRRTTTQERTR